MAKIWLCDGVSSRSAKALQATIAQNMKRVCKNVDITNPLLIEAAVQECFTPAKKRKRADTRRLFARMLNISPSAARRALERRDSVYMEGVKRITAMLQESIAARSIKLKPITQQRRFDPSSGKTRTISILSIEQLLLDHVAVMGMRELAARVGEYQVSSIKGRGAIYGKRAIERWVRQKSCRYAVKLDIRDFYGSVQRPILMQWLTAHVKNEPLLWLVDRLLYTSPRGMAIGSYLSQTLANIFLSDLYHEATERCISKRGTRQVSHALFYMDDMLLIGPNKRQLRYAAFHLMERAGEMGLQVKPQWQVHRITKKHPIDMMGYRFSPYCTTLRKRIFKLARRPLLRARRAYRHGKRMGCRRAVRLASYHGYTARTACHDFLHRVGAVYIFKIAFTTISNAYNILHREAGTRNDRNRQRVYPHHTSHRPRAAGKRGRAGKMARHV